MPTTATTTLDNNDIDNTDHIRASSNDNVDLMGIAPAEMFLEDGQEMAEDQQQQLEPDIQMDSHSDWSDWSFTWRVDGDTLAEDALEQHDTAIEEQKEFEWDPCSNDNPNFDQFTQPCKESVGYGTVFAGLFDDDDDGEGEEELNQATVVLHSLEDEDMVVVAPTSKGEDKVEVSEDNSEDILPPRPQFTICSTEQYQEVGKGKAIQVPINFSYDINVKPSSAERFSSILSAFETQLSNGVASELDLADCFLGKTSEAVSLQMTRKGPALRRSLSTVKDSRKLDSSTLVGISAQPKDLEEMIGKSLRSRLLISPGSKLTIPLECSATDEVTPSICFPVSGVMTAWIANRDERLLDDSAVEKTILDAVKTFMSEDSYSNEDIVSVNYIGSRDLSLPQTGDPVANSLPQTGDVDPSPPAEEDKSFLVKDVPSVKPSETTKKTIGSAGYTGIAAALVALIVAVVGAAQVRRSRRARRRARLEIEQNFDSRSSLDSDSRPSLDGDIEEDAAQASINARGSCAFDSSEHLPANTKESSEPGDDSIWSDSDSDCPLSPNEGAFPATTSPPPTKETAAIATPNSSDREHNEELV